MINLKCCEIHEIKNGRIIESHILIDVMDFLRQADKWVINPSPICQLVLKNPSHQLRYDFQ